MSQFNLDVNKIIDVISSLSCLPYIIQFKQRKASGYTSNVSSNNLIAH